MLAATELPLDCGYRTAAQEGQSKMGFQKPVWIEQGPGPLALPMANYNKAAGAVQAIVVDPVTPDRVFVATVGGGVWMSNNALAVDPSWIPLTDHAPSLTMSAL